MRTPLSILVLLFPLAVGAAEPGKVDRTIGNEPRYVTKEPRYGMIFLGQHPPTRIWLVLDGDTLYLDRNANGNFSDSGEKIEASPSQNAERGLREYEVAEITEKSTGRKHKGFKLTRPNRDSGHVLLSLEIDGLGIQTAGIDREGTLEFALKPEAAPVVHFNGPLQMNLTSNTPLTRNAKGSRLNGCIGTPGIGPGTFAVVPYDEVPEDAHPQVKIHFRHSQKQTSSIQQEIALEHRC